MPKDTTLAEQVYEFTVGHLSDLGQGCPETPQLADERDIKFLGTVLVREVIELSSEDIEGQIDTAADLIIYVLDFAARMGWNLTPYIEEIAAANLRKKFPDGKYRHHESGKVIKPPNYKPADLSSILEDHMKNGSWTT